MNKANQITRTFLFECMLACLLVAPCVASAGVIITSEKQDGVVSSRSDIENSVVLSATRSSEQGDEMSRKNVFIDISTKPTKIDLTTSTGVDLPFAKAVKMIVPQGWKGYLIDDRIAQIKDMTWFAKQVPWTDALAPLLVSHRLVATINWSKKEIGFDISLPYKH